MKKVTCLILSVMLYAGNARSQCKLDYSHYHEVFSESFDNISAPSQLQPNWDFKHIRSATPTLCDWYYGWGCEIYSPLQLSLVTDPNNSGNKYMRLTAIQADIQNPCTGSEGWSATDINAWSHYDNLSHYNPSQTVPFVPYSVVGHNGKRYVSGMLELLKGEIPNTEGWDYGMFEARIKIPGNEGAWPAFWLIKGNTEIDVMDNNSGPGQNWKNGVIDWDNTTDPRGYGVECTKNGPGLDADFHIYTVVWTPTKITFFLDHREMYTIPNGVWNGTNHVSFDKDYKVNLIISMQVSDWASAAEYHMDIDYVKIYKPCVAKVTKGCADVSQLTKDDYTNTPYKTDAGFVNHTLKDPLPTEWDKLVYPAIGSISIDRTINPATNDNDVYYVGTDNRIYKCTRGVDEDHWTNTPISPFDVAGDVVYDPVYHIVVYRTTNNYIHYLNTANAETTFINNPDQQLSPAKGAIKIAGNGDIVFIGADARIHRFSPMNAGWQHQVLGNYPSINQFVKGDLLVGDDIYKIFYKGMDNKLQGIWFNGTNFLCVYIDNLNDPLTAVNSRDGSMTLATNNPNQMPDAVYYIGVDYLLHRFAYNNGWVHQVIPYTYCSPSLGFPCADKLQGNIEWDGHNSVVYSGFDGRVQSFYFANNIWNHVWIDDYWNTNDYCSYDINYNMFATNGSANVKVSADPTGGFKVYYANSSKVLKRFIWEPCENLANIVSPPKHMVNKQGHPNGNDTTNNSIAPHNLEQFSPGINGENPLTIFPNPGNGTFSLAGSIASQSNNIKMEITDIAGRSIMTKEIKAVDGKINENIALSSNIPNGFYRVKVTSDRETRIINYVKQ